MIFIGLLDLFVAIKDRKNPDIEEVRLIKRYIKIARHLYFCSIMKKLYLVRHAKSSWDDYMLTDENRPLSERGKRDAPAMAKMLNEKDPDLEYLLSSPAKRALETAKIFRKVFKLGKDKLDKDSRLYHASPSTMVEVIQNVDDRYQSLAIFGHNPGMTDFLNRFSDASIDNIPTCGVARIDVDIDTWKKFSYERGKLLAFYYPKMFGLF